MGTNPIPCAHCGLPAPAPVSPESPVFCCAGCKTVFEILQARGLGRYYDLKRELGGALRAPTPAAEPVTESKAYDYLDRADVREAFARGSEMSFYLEGVHCAACVWLIEKVPDLVQNVRSVRLDFGKSVATVLLQEDASASFGEVAREFHRLGYRPHPVRDGQGDELRRLENRSMLIRIGVAAACTGNIMLMAVALYAGAGGEWGERFRWISLGLYLPVVFYSAVPFYRSAWAALRTRAMSIDVPIVLGVVVGSIASLANLVADFAGPGGSAAGHVYFDSLAALVFLLLSSRYVLRRTQQAALDSSGLMQFLAPSFVRRKRPDGMTEQISAEALKPGDIVEVRASEAVPADGHVSKGSSTLNCSLLTGESEWIPVKEGDAVFAGTVNQDRPLEVRVTVSGSATRLGRILAATAEGLARKAPIVTLTDQLSKGFVWGTLALGAVVFALGWRFGLQEAVNRALAIFIVTCPCALALATPLAMTVALGKAAAAGFLIKGSDVLEKLSDARSVILDKTGTLTSGSFDVLEWEGCEGDLALSVLALESRSCHPVARALVRHCEAVLTNGGTMRMPEIPEVVGFRETIGSGVEGAVSGVRYQIRQRGEAPAADQKPGTDIVVLREGLLAARVRLGDRLRSGSAEAVGQLRELGLRPLIFSGDTKSIVRKVASQVGVPVEDAHGELSPEMKKSLAARYERPIVVGDGANDAVALASAYVGVAVHGGMEVSLRAADVYLQTPGVEPLVRLVSIARETMRVVRRNLWFSLFYNVAGVGAALFGAVDPLFAAVLMPVSALTVFVSSWAGTAAQRAALKGGAR